MNDPITQQGNDFTVGSEPTGIVHDTLSQRDVEALATAFKAQAECRSVILDDEIIFKLGGLAGQLCTAIIAGNPAEYADTPEAAVFLVGDLMRNFTFTPKPDGLVVPKMDDRNTQAIASFIMERDPEEFVDSPQGAIAIAQRLVKNFGVVPKTF